MRASVLLIAMLLIFSVPSYSGDEKPKSEAAPDAKVYLVYSTMQGRTAVLEGVEVVDFKGIKCLKGRHADLTWSKGKVYYIPVDKIESIIEFDSLEQYKQAVQNFHEGQMK